MIVIHEKYKKNLKIFYMMISNKRIMNNFINKLNVYYYKKILGISWKIRVAQKLTKKKKPYSRTIWLDNFIKKINVYCYEKLLGVSLIIFYPLI
jgi:hypothetical protein